MIDWVDILYTSVPMIVIGAVLVIRGSRSIRDAVDQPDEYEPARGSAHAFPAGWLLIVAGCLLASYRLIPSGPRGRTPSRRIAPAAEDRPASIRGFVTDGVYRNPYFGLRLPLEPGWRAVPLDEVQRANRHPELGDPGRGLLLALVKEPREGEPAGVALLLFAERLPSHPSIRTGEQLLTYVLDELNRNPEPPKHVVRGNVSIFGGMDFNHITYIHPMGENDVPSALWITAKKGYALGFWGSSAAENGLEEAESLLQNMSPETLQ